MSVIASRLDEPNPYETNLEAIKQLVSPRLARYRVADGDREIRVRQAAAPGAEGPHHDDAMTRTDDCFAVFCRGLESESRVARNKDCESAQI